MLEKYLQMFGELRTDRGRDRYPEITYHRALDLRWESAVSMVSAQITLKPSGPLPFLIYTV
jgi:hypothetical protein